MMKNGPLYAFRRSIFIRCDMRDMPLESVPLIECTNLPEHSFAHFDFAFPIMAIVIFTVDHAKLCKMISKRSTKLRFFLNT